jgi:hypothetical protein
VIARRPTPNLHGSWRSRRPAAHRAAASSSARPKRPARAAQTRLRLWGDLGTHPTERIALLGPLWAVSSVFGSSMALGRWSTRARRRRPNAPGGRSAVVVGDVRRAQLVERNSRLTFWDGFSGHAKPLRVWAGESDGFILGRHPGTGHDLNVPEPLSITERTLRLFRARNERFYEKILDERAIYVIYFARYEPKRSYRD